MESKTVHGHIVDGVFCDANGNPIPLEATINENPGAEDEFGELSKHKGENNTSGQEGDGSSAKGKGNKSGGQGGQGSSQGSGKQGSNSQGNSNNSGKGQGKGNSQGQKQKKTPDPNKIYVDILTGKKRIWVVDNAQGDDIKGHWEEI